MTHFLNSHITAEEIKKAIQKLKCKKAAGVDGISAGNFSPSWESILGQNLNQPRNVGDRSKSAFLHSMRM